MQSAPRHSTMSLLSTADAARNLRLMKKKNPEYHNIDPTDESQIKCYKLLRQVSSKVFPGPFMHAWKKQRLDVHTGVRYKQEFWLVPFVNFPAGLPASVQHFVVPKGELYTMRDVSGHAINPGNNWLVDTEHQRQGLGPRVQTVEVYLNASTKFKDVGEHAALEGGGAEPGSEHPGDEGHGVSEASVPEPLHDASAPAESSHADPLKERFRTLRTKLETAFQNEHIWSDDPLDYFHAGAWAMAVTEAVECMPDGPPRNAVSEKFLKLLTSLLLSHRCFSVLKNFTPIYTRLHKAGALETSMHKLILGLAAVDADAKELKPLNMSFADFESRTEFQSSPLFSNHVAVVTEKRLLQAKSEQNPEKCFHLLVQLGKLPHLPAKLRSEVSMATVVLDGSKPAAERLSFIRSTPEAALTLAEWAPTSALCVAAHILVGGAASAIRPGTPWASFKCAVELLVHIGEDVEQEEYQALLAIVSTFPKIPDWADKVLQAACCLRFGLSEWRIAEPVVASELALFPSPSKDSFMKMLKSVKRFLATELKVNGAVPWIAVADAVIAQWKQEKEDARAQQKERKAQGGKGPTSLETAASSDELPDVEIAGREAEAEAADASASAPGTPPALNGPTGGLALDMTLAEDVGAPADQKKPEAPIPHDDAVPETPAKQQKVEDDPEAAAPPIDSSAETPSPTALHLGTIVTTTARVEKTKYDGKKAQIVANHRHRFYRVKFLSGPAQGTEKDVLKTTVFLQRPSCYHGGIAAALGAEIAGGNAAAAPHNAHVSDVFD